ncbi:MAG: hypothetical protein M1435_00395 [Actinobacteria bacterium]|nr:hypothetical protein [Actinomycetota bacterium]MDA8301942.1 hypothetical protein [Actinomycetota bacterium]
MELLRLAEGFQGVPTQEIALAIGETLFYKVAGAALLDARNTGRWEGASTGVSVPLYRGVRYRVGATRGHYVQAEPVLGAIDRGALYLTNHRVLFTGPKQTREVAFAKLVGFQHDQQTGSTAFSLLNRQKPVTVNYGSAASPQFRFRLDLALAHYRGTREVLVRQVLQRLAALDATRPVATSP